MSELDTYLTLTQPNDSIKSLVVCTTGGSVTVPIRQIWYDSKAIFGEDATDMYFVDFDDESGPQCIFAYADIVEIDYHTSENTICVFLSLDSLTSRL